MIEIVKPSYEEILGIKPDVKYLTYNPEIKWYAVKYDEKIASYIGHEIVGKKRLGRLILYQSIGIKGFAESPFQISKTIKR
jgi:hypothetical protein